MGIDIEALNESELLTVLGDGDWSIALLNNYPDLVVRADWREGYHKA